MKTIQQCGICNGPDLIPVWELPKFPLTERLGPYAPAACPGVDQALLLCSSCGHVQLGHQLDPRTLYDSHYAFRTSASDSAVSGSAFFIDSLEKMTEGRRFNSLLDIGGNDLYLARQLEKKARNRSVIDPVCRDQDGEMVEGIKIHGRLIESVDLGRDIVPPDLVVSRHTLEHISKPREVILQLFKECPDDCLYLFEIPCFDNLMEALRFDAVFHQHYHYYSLLSFRRLLWETGGEDLAHTYNYQGSCGGALLVLFRKAKGRMEKPVVDAKKKRAEIANRIENYSLQMKTLSSLLKSLPGKIYGYGASLMLATLSYHLQDDFSRLECILDDDPKKDGLTYENIPVTVRFCGKYPPEPDAHFLITSLESLRPIFEKVLDFRPRRILSPLFA